MFQLKIIIASTRPGRKGPAIAAWFTEIARKHPEFNVEVLDLAEINLPFLDEPNHPRLRQYTQPHTKAWSATIEAADAFVIVTPEYNYAFPATIKNALDFLFQEWGYKPVGFVSYGGVSGGTRAVQLLKQVVTTLNMMPMVPAVNVPFFTQHLSAEGQFVANESLNRSAEGLLKELLAWTGALQPMRTKSV